MTASGLKRRVKRELSGERPRVWIGKGGLSSQVLAEIESQLERAEMVKVRILRSALKDAKAVLIAQSISRDTKSSLIEVRGNTFILYRRRKQNK